MDLRRSVNEKIYEVSKRTLLIIAGIVWMIAGFNVARLGILSYGVTEVLWYIILLSAAGVLFVVEFIRYNRVSE